MVNMAKKREGFSSKTLVVLKDIFCERGEAMKKTLIIGGILLCMCLSGCQAQNNIPVTDKGPVYGPYPMIQAQEANDEYDSIAEFQEHSNKPAFLLGSNVSRTANAASSNASLVLEAVATRVSVGESYVDVYYDCKLEDKEFKVRLGTYDSKDGADDVQYVLENNSGIFTEMDIDGTTVYYCPGMDIEFYNSYMMVLSGQMFVINIEKGYDSEVAAIMDYIN